MNINKHIKCLICSMMLLCLYIFYNKGEVIMADENKVTIYLAGDSTVCDWDVIKTKDYYEPQAGWGQMLYKFLDSSQVEVVNGAISGYSSKTFYEGSASKNDYVKHLDELLKEAKKNDILLIQFGHNDSAPPNEEQKITRPDIAERYVTPEIFKQYLEKYIIDARNKGVIPILVTPPGRLSINKEGEFVTGFTDYIEKMKELAKEKECALIDLDKQSREYYTFLGEEKVKDVFLYCAPNVYNSYYKKGVSDSTHFQKFGAISLARFVAISLKELGINDLKNVIINEEKPENVVDAPKIINTKTSALGDFTISFEKVEGADMYSVYMENILPNGTSKGFNLLGFTDKTEFVVSNLNPNVEFNFMVKSKNMLGESLNGTKVVKEAKEQINNNKLSNEEINESDNNVFKIVIGTALIITTFFVALMLIKKIKKIKE